MIRKSNFLIFSLRFCVKKSVLIRTRVNALRKPGDAFLLHYIYRPWAVCVRSVRRQKKIQSLISNYVNVKKWLLLVKLKKFN